MENEKEIRGSQDANSLPFDVGNSNDDDLEIDVIDPSGSRWPTPVRDSLNFADVEGRFKPSSWTKVLLNMDGKRGRDDATALAVAKELNITSLRGRPRNPHRALELCGVIKPEAGATRLAKLGRILRDMSDENWLRQYLAREALDFLCRFQSDNPVDRKDWPAGCRVHPYWMVLRAACLLDYKIHWDEVNREIMRTMKDEDFSAVVARIAEARKHTGYEGFIGSKNDGAGLLNARTWPAGEKAPAGKTPVGQLKDQRFTPFLKLAGFGELLLKSAGIGGDGWWNVPENVREIVQEMVQEVPPHVEFEDEADWIEWLYEAKVAAAGAVPTNAPIQLEKQVVEIEVPTPIAELTLVKLKKAIETYTPELKYSDTLLAAIVAAVRSGDGKSFIILRGISGTGKSKLVSALASAVFQVPIASAPVYHQIEVRPDWTDVTNVLGYHDPVRGEYVRPRFMQALEIANAAFISKGTDAFPVFVCLDEMNLAPIEQYLADCLSAMESGFALDHGILENGVPKEIRWPPNLFLFGTINVDETTAEISDKVLDRAQVIDTSDIEIGEALREWLQQTKHLSADDKNLVEVGLVTVWNALRGVHRHFGFRTAKAIVRFVDEAIASSDGVLDAASALDAQLAQKVLVKLRGEGEQWSIPLNSIQSAIVSLSSGNRSLRIVERMISDHQRLGSFQFWE